MSKYEFNSTDIGTDERDTDDEPADKEKFSVFDGEVDNDKGGNGE